MTILYIAGPMTGMPGLNFPAFVEAAKELRAAGYIVHSPVEINDGYPKEWGPCLRRDIRALMKCDGVATLTGWRKSKGANIEVELAMRLSMEAYGVDRWLRIAP